MKKYLLIITLLVMTSCKRNKPDEQMTIKLYHCDGSIAEEYEDIQIKSYQFGDQYIYIKLTNGEEVLWSGHYIVKNK